MTLTVDYIDENRVIFAMLFHHWESAITTYNKLAVELIFFYRKNENMETTVFLYRGQVRSTDVVLCIA